MTNKVLGMLRRLLNMVRRLFKKDTPTSSDPVTPLPSYMRHDKPESRYVQLRSVSANSPKHQPCDKCGSRVGRVRRTAKIVEYYCSKCNLVMVLSLRQKRRRPVYNINRKRRRWHLGRKKQEA